MGFAVLYVCTGNVCRSPVAELLLSARLAQLGRGNDVTVSSAGVGALVGSGIDASSAATLAKWGIDPTQHRARQFEDWMAVEADLVLTAERLHRDRVMSDVPTAFRRTFTMKEFARLARHADPGPPAEVVAQLSRIRGIDGAVPVTVDDTSDPFGGSLARAESIATQIAATVQTTVGVLGLRRPGPGSRGPDTAVEIPRRPRPYPDR